MYYVNLGPPNRPENPHICTRDVKGTLLPISFDCKGQPRAGQEDGKQDFPGKGRRRRKEKGDLSCQEERRDTKSERCRSESIADM